MKSHISIILCILLTVSLTFSLNKITSFSDFGNTTSQTAHPSQDVSSQESFESASSPASQSQQTAPSLESDITSTISEVIVADEGTVMDEKQSPALSQAVSVPTAHTAIPESDYYQYSQLSSQDKKVYEYISNAIKNTVNVVNIKDCRSNVSTVSNIFEKVVADFPQYFWVTRFISMVSSTSGNVHYIILYYTDGTTVDTVDKSFNLTTTADRSIIASQINEFNSKTKSVLGSISPSASQIQKEKLIHDFLLESIEYNYAAVNTKIELGKPYSRAFDSYGAINGSAVCEGYSKLFQYLCYCIGINSTTVTGSANGGNHMWNTVKLENNWYHIDVTWDDTASFVPYYAYFNLTESEITALNHSIDFENLKVPAATSTDLSFTATFGIYISSADKPPENLENAVNYAIKYSNKYIIVKLNSITPSSNYLNTHFLSHSSTLKKEFAKKGKQLLLENSYTTIGDFMYFTVK